MDEREKLRAATVRARAEEHFGMTPLARLRLGVTYLQEQAAKEDLDAKWERRRPHIMR